METNLTSELYRLAQRDYDQSLAEQRDLAMSSRVCCPECGAADGMIALSPENILAYLDEPRRYPWPARGVFHREGVNNELYTPCTVCCSEIPPGYQPWDKMDARAWSHQFVEWYPPDEPPEVDPSLDDPLPYEDQAFDWWLEQAYEDRSWSDWE